MHGTHEPNKRTSNPQSVCGWGGVHGDMVVQSLTDGHEVVIGLCGQYNAAQIYKE